MRAAGKVPLGRALSKLGILSRSAAVVAVRAGRVAVNGRVIVDPNTPIVPERIAVAIDGVPVGRARWRTLLLYKPRGVVTTRRDPQGRRTVFDVVGDEGQGLVAVGRLDLASTGLLLLTTDSRLADRVTDPAARVSRVYLVTVRGKVEPSEVARLEAGVTSGRDLLQPSHVQLRKSSTRESHLVVELREGRNREVKRLFEAVGHEVTRLKRVSFGGLDLGTLKPGEWREVSRAEIARAFPSIEGVSREA